MNCGVVIRTECCKSNCSKEQIDDDDVQSTDEYEEGSADEEELDKAKSERDRKAIRRITADARKLNKTLKEMRNTSVKKCPHCGEKL